MLRLDLAREAPQPVACTPSLSLHQDLKQGCAAQTWDASIETAKARRRAGRSLVSQLFKRLTAVSTPLALLFQGDEGCAGYLKQVMVPPCSISDLCVPALPCLRSRL